MRDINDYSFYEFSSFTMAKIRKILQGAPITVEENHISRDFPDLLEKVQLYRKTGSNIPTCLETEIYDIELALDMTIPMAMRPIATDLKGVLVPQVHDGQYFLSLDEFRTFEHSTRKKDQNAFPIMTESNEYIVGMFYYHVFSIDKKTLKMKAS